MPAPSRLTIITVKNQNFFFDFLKLYSELGKVNFFLFLSSLLVLFQEEIAISKKFAIRENSIATNENGENFNSILALQFDLNTDYKLLV